MMRRARETLEVHVGAARVDRLALRAEPLTFMRRVVGMLRVSMLLMLLPAATALGAPGGLAPPSGVGAKTPGVWRWKGISDADYAAGAILGFSLSVALVSFEPAERGRRGGVLFDQELRSTLRADTEVGRDRANQISTMLQHTLIALPFVLDAAVLGYGVRSSPESASAMFTINAQSFLLTSLVTYLSKTAVSRERPYVAACPDYSCAARSRNKSFISGHSAAAFTGAGLVCAHHEALGLFGSRAADDGACVGALALASLGSVLRVVSDEHYATDVLAGAAVGLVSGYVIPRLIHYVLPASED